MSNPARISVEARSAGAKGATSPKLARGLVSRVRLVETANTPSLSFDLS